MSGFPRPIILTSGTAAKLPAAGVVIGQVYWAYDTGVLYIWSGTAWDATASGGFANPMTSVGDLILGGTAGAATRLAIGANTYVLTSNGTTAAWAAAAGGFANPMTTAGDLIVGGASGAAGRLAVGAANQGVGITSGAPAWVGDTAWTVVGSGGGAPAFQNSWVNYGGSNVPLQFRKTASGMVIIEGGCKSGSAGTVVFTLPAGYRPSAQLLLIVAGAGGVTPQISFVESTGTVSAPDGVSGSFFTASFFADA